MKKALLFIIVATLTSLPLSAQADPSHRGEARRDARERVQDARQTRKTKVRAAREEARAEIREARQDARDAHGANQEDVREPAAAPAAKH